THTHTPGGRWRVCVSESVCVFDREKSCRERVYVCVCVCVCVCLCVCVCVPTCVLTHLCCEHAGVCPRARVCVCQHANVHLSSCLVCVCVCVPVCGCGFVIVSMRVVVILFGLRGQTSVLCGTRA